jgi:hypothetical protein
MIKNQLVDFNLIFWSYASTTWHPNPTAHVDALLSQEAFMVAANQYPAHAQGRRLDAALAGWTARPQSFTGSYRPQADTREEDYRLSDKESFCCDRATD